MKQAQKYFPTFHKLLFLVFLFYSFLLQGSPLHPPSQREITITKDGVRLVFKRYVRKKGQPVILVHGLAQNGKHWDLDLPRINFARFLYFHGFDVWIANLRSHGKGKYKSDTPKKSWSVDDFAIYDIPAIVNKVYHTTKKRPFYIGFSMGGMLGYMYLQGVYYHPKTHRVVSSLELAIQRNLKLKGLITIASPVAMAWKIKPTLTTLVNPKFYYDYNYILDGMPGRELTMYSFSVMKKVPLPKWIQLLIPLRPWKSKVSPFLYFWGNRFPFNYVWHYPNMTPKAMDAILKHTVDSTSGKVLAQFTHWCVTRSFCEYNVGFSRKKPYKYNENLYKVFCPLLMLAGDKDKLVCDDVLYYSGYMKVSSIDKEFVSFKGFGHIDLCVGKRAPLQVYPIILNWLKKRLPKDTP